MEKQFPKNVRQIGNVSDEPKIYVEDYVDTYVNQMKGRYADHPLGIALAGEIMIQDGQPVVYISGAVRMKEVAGDGVDIVLSEETIRQVEEDRKRYFPSEEIVGWCLIEDGKPMGRHREISKIHTRYFSKDQSIFIWKDAADGEEVFYAFKYGELMQMGGHYIYYEKNPAMQNYMISTRKKIGVTPSEVVEDRAAKDFRSAVRERMESKTERQSSRFVYAASILLVVVVLAIGISTLNNYDKMEAVQTSLETLTRSVNQPQQQAEAEDPDVENSEGEAGTDKPDTVKQETEQVSAPEDGQDTGADAAVSQEELNLSEEDYYTVKKGDTLDTISIKVYGDSSHVDAICRMNGLSDGNLIFIGQKLLLP